MIRTALLALLALTACTPAAAASPPPEVVPHMVQLRPTENPSSDYTFAVSAAPTCWAGLAQSAEHPCNGEATSPSLVPGPVVSSGPATGSHDPADPTSTPRTHSVGPAVRFFRGQATWWFSFGHGYYVAVNPDLHIPNGTIVQVCDAKAQGCVPAPVITTCACLGHDSGRIVDLSRDLFSRFADPSLGVTQVVIEVTG